MTDYNEAIECLKRIKEFLLHKTKEIDFQDLRDIKQALINTQEQEQENTKYKQLEEQIGCPLDVGVWLLQDKPILVLNPIDRTLQEIKHPLNFYDSTRQAFDIRNECFKSTYAKRIWTTGGLIVPLKDYKKLFWIKRG